jgi:hypothetical protein
MTKTNANTPAFISPGAFEIDGESRPGLITALLLEDGQLEIAIQPLCQLPFEIRDLRIVLDDQDLRSVNALLRDQAGEASADALDELTETTHAATTAAS